MQEVIEVAPESERSWTFRTIHCTTLTVEELTELYDVFHGVFCGSSGYSECRDSFLSANADESKHKKIIDNNHDNGDGISYGRIDENEDEKSIEVTFSERLRVWLRFHTPFPLDFDSPVIKEVSRITDYKQI